MNLGQRVETNLRRRVDALFGWARRPRLPQRTVRLRLTLLYGALFLASGAALLAITYVLAWNATTVHLPTGRNSPGQVVTAPAAQRRAELAHQHAVVMHQLLESCGIALAVTAVLSITLGWLVAGRVLRPIRTMTAATQRISDQNLHQRLSVAGPDDELKRLGDTIDDLLARLESAFEAQRRFVANASHELRTPLTIMRTALDVATNKPESPAPGVTVLAGKIRVGLDKADRLVESFLTLARAQHGAVRHSTVALDKLAATVLADHRVAIRDMRLTIHQDQHETPANGTEALLTHLTDNLIDNAIRHNQPGGWIHVTTTTDTDANTARLVVENSGGILESHQVRDLVQPFRRVSPDRTSSSDTSVGLGLSIVATIVATHDGTLDLHARPNGGLRVTVALPLATQPALTAGTPA
ncbi:MAG TPA: HAMP domain-containing sensor histidine kinase [Streptosporangiaceae bacterium]